METPINYRDGAAYKRVEASVLDLIYTHGRVRQKDRDMWDYRIGAMCCSCCTNSDTAEWLQFAICNGLHQKYPFDVTKTVVNAARRILETARNV